jgi:hypothetical protein
VKGDGACGEISRGTWETRRGGRGGANVGRESITAVRLRRESEGFIVAEKRVTTVERRDPTEGASL